MSARIVALFEAARANGAFNGLSKSARDTLRVLCELADDDGVVTFPDGNAVRVIAQHLNREQRRARRRGCGHVC